MQEYRIKIIQFYVRSQEGIKEKTISLLFSSAGSGLQLNNITG